MADRFNMAQRFRGFLPVVVDVETGGLEVFAEFYGQGEADIAQADNGKF